MPARNPIAWLMTDERMGDALWAALRRLPPGGGVVFRHQDTPAAERRRLLRRVERIAAARRLVLVVRGGGSGKAGVHGVDGRRRAGTLRTAAAHDRRQAIAAIRGGATVLFVSPVFATRSHPLARPLGPMAAARITAGLDVATVALGGMSAQRWRRIARLGFDGWAGIDAWTVNGTARQKRKIVPT